MCVWGMPEVCGRVVGGEDDLQPPGLGPHLLLQEDAARPRLDAALGAHQRRHQSLRPKGVPAEKAHDDSAGQETIVR